MNDSFSVFHKYTKEEYSLLISDAIIVLDTNVLINLYRYKSSTRKKLLNVLKSLEDRVFVPHHVALEYYRNKDLVISDQLNTYGSVEKIFNEQYQSLISNLSELNLEKRHFNIDPKSCLDNIELAITNFKADLQDLKQELAHLKKRDSIRESLDFLFNNNIGNPFEQSELDALFSEGKKRYEHSLPPGYSDNIKTEKFSFAGLYYQQRFGDLIIWKQIIKHAKDHELNDIIFVTDDNKEDWWWYPNGKNKSNKLGCRPELREEIIRDAGVKRFNIYNTNKFLDLIDEERKLIENDQINEIKDISEYYSNKNSSKNKWLFDQEEDIKFIASTAIAEWLNDHGYVYSDSSIESYPFQSNSIKQFDLIVSKNNSLVGVEILFPNVEKNIKVITREVKKIINLGEYISHNEIIEVKVILPFDDYLLLKLWHEETKRYFEDDILQNIIDLGITFYIGFGLLHLENFERPRFEIIEEINLLF